ncbi:MAG: response regulator [Pirellulaceae bacterium]
MPSIADQLIIRVAKLRQNDKVSIDSVQYLPKLDLREPEENSPQAPIRIIVVDDEASVLDVLGKLLRAKGYRAECFSNAVDALASIKPTDQGCVITDLEMPGLSGIGLQLRLKELGSCLSLIVITAHADVPRTIEIMSGGATTLLEKPFKADELVRHINRAIVASRQSAARRQRIASASLRLERLNHEELEIMQLAARGFPNKAIAQQLVLSPRTVDRRRQSALNKLEINSVADFAVLCEIASWPLATV